MVGKRGKDCGPVEQYKRELMVSHSARHRFARGGRGGDGGGGRGRRRIFQKRKKLGWCTNIGIVVIAINTLHLTLGPIIFHFFSLCPYFFCNLCYGVI